MTLREWLETRRPPVPGAFREWVAPGDPGAAAGVESLLHEAETALDRALAPDGRPRAGAFDLLAADAFVTYACEAALRENDPLEVLHGMVRRLTR